MVILTKCHKNWVQIVDYLLIAYFWPGGQFCWYILYLIRILWFVQNTMNNVAFLAYLIHVTNRKAKIHFLLQKWNSFYIHISWYPETSWGKHEMLYFTTFNRLNSKIRTYMKSTWAFPWNHLIWKALCNFLLPFAGREAAGEGPL